MRLPLAIGIALATTMVAPRLAAADDAAGGLMLNHTWLQSGDEARTSLSRGFGVEMGAVGRREPFLMTIGAFYALGQPEGQKRMRDVYDVRFGFGLKPKMRRARLVVPFMSVGLDFLYVSTRSAIDGSKAAGATLGFDARGGIFGIFGKKWIYQASISYIGAIVPGTGDGLDGAVFQIGIGKLMFP
jgi:hypothetical protein